MSSRRDPFGSELRPLVEPVGALLSALHTAERQAEDELRAVDPAHARSARNLVHYLSLRRHDLRELQDKLASVGLSSLGRAESCVEATLANVRDLLARALQAEPPPRPEHALTLVEGRRRLLHTTALLLGPAPTGRRTRIMVTLPSEAATDPALVRELLRGGMNLARINCAHDCEADWAKMIAHVRRSAAELGRSCRVQLDLAGPKLRTGALAPGPEVIKVKPTRDVRGLAVAPGRAWLVPDGAATRAPAAGGAIVPVPSAWLARLRAGDRVRIRDARDKSRELTVVEITPGGALVETGHSVYFESGSRLEHPAGDAAVGRLPAREQPLMLRPGDTLLLTRAPTPGRAGAPPSISCTLPEVFADVEVGERICFDDGDIGGRIVGVDPERLTIEITDARPEGSKLRADKGINLPDTSLRLPSLAADDDANLAFIAAHADLVGYSFVRRPSDVVELHDRLATLGRSDLGVVLKIETREGFENLPRLLLAAMRRPVVGVMIARGDLAVECGWERLAELQEEILWICEAAHLPVIWATQVLETLTKEGRPSRAEITDAAMSERAECVMLNKGAHVTEAVQSLDDILRRMEGHQAKKRSMLRPLALAERFAVHH
jgi:pyruvate kinase